LHFFASNINWTYIALCERIHDHALYVLTPWWSKVSWYFACFLIWRYNQFVVKACRRSSSISLSWARCVKAGARKGRLSRWYHVGKIKKNNNYHESAIHFHRKVICDFEKSHGSAVTKSETRLRTIRKVFLIAERHNLDLNSWSLVSITQHPQSKKSTRSVFFITATPQHGYSKMSNCTNLIFDCTNIFQVFP
jgi:hypothetical protein